TAFTASRLQTLGTAPLTFSLREGEVFGIAGLSGSGQAELIRMLFGDGRISAGTMHLAGEPYAPTSPASAWQSGVAYVPRERRAEGLVMRRPIFENVTLAHLKRQSRAGTWLTPRREKQFAAELGANMRLKAVG